MKIAIFTDTFIPQVNGVSRTLQKLEGYLVEKKIDHRFFVPETVKEDSFSSSVHRFTSIPFFLYPECRIALPNILHIRKQLRDFQPDLIHVTTPFNIGLSGWYYGQKMNIPMVASYHTNFDSYLHYYDLEFLSKWIWKYLRWFHQPFLKTFVPSQETKQELTKRGFSNLDLWQRGVDCALFHPDYNKRNLKEKYGIDSRFVLTYVGRLAPEKHIDVLMAVAQQLPSSIKEQVHWLIAGDGPLREEMIKHKPDNMTFTGFLSEENLAEVYAGSTLLIFPSTTETFGNVVLESFACGTPVIGAYAGGVKEIIEDRKTGILCQPGEKDHFIQSIIRLLENEQVLNNMGVEARKYALSQSWDMIFNQLITDYNSAIIHYDYQRYA